MKRGLLPLVAAMALTACLDEISPVAVDPTLPDQKCASPSASLAARQASLNATPPVYVAARRVVILPYTPEHIRGDGLVLVHDQAGPLVWSSSKPAERLGWLKRATAMNEGDWVVGHTETGTAALLHVGVKVTQLGNMSANAINQHALVAGTADNRAVLWTPCNGNIVLATPEGSTSAANDLNDASNVVGYVQTPPPSGFPGATRRAALWTTSNGQRVDIPGLSAEHRSVFATAVNDQNQVVGFSGNLAVTARGQDSGRAFLWSASGGTIDLGTLGGDYSIALDINNAGEVVGVSRDAQGREHAFVWRRETGMEKLDAVGEASSSAISINNRGEIVGTVGTRGAAWVAADDNTRWPPSADAVKPSVSYVNAHPDTVYTFDADRTVNLSVGAADAGSGVKSVQLTFKDPSGASKPCNMTLAGGTIANGSWSCPFVVPKGTHGLYRFEKVVITDHAGNVYDTWPNGEMFQKEFLAHGASDVSAPAVWHVDVQPQSVNVGTGSKVVTVYVAFRDESGISPIDFSVNVISPDSQQGHVCSGGSLAGGSLADGVMTCNLHFNAQDNDGVWVINRITVWDKWSNGKSYTRAEIQRLGTNTTITVRR